MELSLGVAALVLFSAALHAGWNTMVKRSGDSLFTTAVIMGTGSAVCALLLPWVEPPDPASWPYLAVSVLLHNLYFALLLQAYRFGDLSQAYPIARGTSPLIVATGSVFLLGESLGPLQVGGVLLVAGGIASLAGLGRPRATVDGRAVPYALACGVSIGAFSLVDALGVRASQRPLSFAVWLTAYEALPLVLFAVWLRRHTLAESLGSSGWSAPVGGLLAAGAYAIALWAYAHAPAASVAALRETSVVMAALIGALRLGEPFGHRRVLAAAVVVAGVAVLNLAG